jgi:hypothetical protein
VRTARNSPAVNASPVWRGWPTSSAAVPDGAWAAVRGP